MGKMYLLRSPGEVWTFNRPNFVPDGNGLRGQAAESSSHAWLSLRDHWPKSGVQPRNMFRVRLVTSLLGEKQNTTNRNSTVLEETPSRTSPKATSRMHKEKHKQNQLCNPGPSSHGKETREKPVEHNKLAKILSSMQISPAMQISPPYTTVFWDQQPVMDVCPPCKAHVRPMNNIVCSSPHKWAWDSFLVILYTLTLERVPSFNNTLNLFFPESMAKGSSAGFT